MTIHLSTLAVQGVPFSTYAAAIPLSYFEAIIPTRRWIV
jgi:hypothetical protein